MTDETAPLSLPVPERQAPEAYAHHHVHSFYSILDGLNDPYDIVREAGNHVEYNLAQLRGSLDGLTPEQLAGVVIAYEPVWAIGTGRVASAADAQEVCGAIRAELAALTSPQVADGIRVLYGGSMNAKNVAELIAQPDVDGGLVGGASLDGEQFAILSAIAAGGPLP